MSKTFTNAPRVTTLATADILAGDIGGVSSGITAGNFRKALFAFAAADPLNIGALTAVGNSTITGTLSGITTLTATTLIGTLSSAPQTGITALGTQGADLLFTDAAYDIGKTGATRPRDIFASRNIVAGGTLKVAGTSAVAMDWSGAGTAAQYWQANSAGASLICGIESLAGGGILSGTSGYSAIFGTLGLAPVHFFTQAIVRLTLNSAGSLIFTSAATKIIPGATSLSLRNTADSADNLLIADAGTITTRGNVVVGGTLSIPSGGGPFVTILGNAIIGPRSTGYTNAWTGVSNRLTAYDPSSITLIQLAQRVKALQDDLTVHGLIGA